ncbi:D-alanyl-D-alanine carboxypeptidase [Coleofasciculus sp. F4-SAH-05]|uniref:D-alanyl-D-alanine carboxypeptidase n=1 Tax=Coleofasciculus sp. F4-SAH-05 TaxID=3069525 RepID=UPI0033020350
MLQRIGAGLIASSIAALLVKIVGMQAATLDWNQVETVQSLSWQDTALFTLPKPDPNAEATINQYLQDLKNKGSLPDNQGIWIQSGLNVLAEHQGKIPRPAASLTKIATTLVTLSQWRPDHEFETQVGATGDIRDGVLEGDLVIKGGGDPLFVWEEAIGLGNSLNRLGIRRVNGNLVIVGKFHLNYEENPTRSGELLRIGLNGKTWSRSVIRHHGRMSPGTPKPELVISGQVKTVKIPPDNTRILLRHQSLPLAEILREMNIYSNNGMAQILADAVGGAEVVAKEAATLANVPEAEIQLINGSGLGTENQISPRAATAMLIALEKLLTPHNLGVIDVFPLAGRDKNGTIYARNLPEGTAMKTGTLRQVSALAGVMPTRERDRVWFAIINGGNNIWEFRQQQDQLLDKLTQNWGNQPSLNPKTALSRSKLGDPKRNKVVAN